jgi:hypothetical protein
MGVGTLFYVLIALCMPIYELVRLVRGESSLARWRVVAVQFSYAIGIVVSITLAGQLLALLLGNLGPGSIGVADLINSAFQKGVPGSVWSWPIIASLLLLAGILTAIEALRWIITLADRGGSDDVSTPATLSDEAVNS